MSDQEKNPPKSSNARPADPLGGNLVNPEQYGVFLVSVQRAVEFWESLVEAVGERRAKQIMKFVAGDKKSGPRERSEDYLMTLTIVLFIRFFGLFKSDEKLAKLILKSGPSFVRCKSGRSFIVVDQIEESLCRGETIVQRTPINKSLPAMKKQVGRVRRLLIEDKLLPKEWAPKPYYRE
jgi:hypothetical protein